MDLGEVLEKYLGMGREARERFVNTLLEIILSSPNTERIPEEVGWKILNGFRSNTLNDPANVEILLKAVGIAEPEKLRRILREIPWK